MEVLLKNKKIFLFIISFLIFVGLSFNIFVQEDKEAPVTTKLMVSQMNNYRGKDDKEFN